MLVLRRKAGEAIVLNGVITIHVLAVEGERVKLGISAPPEVVIVRSELLEGPASATGPTAPTPGMQAPLGQGPQPFRERGREASSEEPDDPSARPRGLNFPGGPTRLATQRTDVEEPRPLSSGPLRYP